MSYDLCLLPQAKKPYYIENIRMNIYSLEEPVSYTHLGRKRISGRGGGARGFYRVLRPGRIYGSLYADRTEEAAE